MGKEGGRGCQKCCCCADGVFDWFTRTLFKFTPEKLTKVVYHWNFYKSQGNTFEYFIILMGDLTLGWL